MLVQLSEYVCVSVYVQVYARAYLCLRMCVCVCVCAYVCVYIDICHQSEGPQTRVMVFVCTLS